MLSRADRHCRSNRRRYRRGNAVALAAKEYSLGIVKSTVVGALGGGVGGYLLEAVIPPTVTAARDPVIDDSAVNVGWLPPL
jgi:hypothetical protein